MTTRVLAIVIATGLLACGPPLPPEPPVVAPVVTVEPDAAEAAPPSTKCEVVATVLDAEGKPHTERRTADDCRSAYDAFGPTAWVQSVAGLSGREELTEIWDVPATPGAQRCSIGIEIETARAKGHGEGVDGDEAKLKAWEDACAQLGLADPECRKRTRSRSTSLRLYLSNGVKEAEATLELIASERAEGAGTGETKLDACRAAIRDACQGNRCRKATLTVRLIDGVPFGRPQGWPPRPGLFRKAPSPPSP